MIKAITEATTGKQIHTFSRVFTRSCAISRRCIKPCAASIQCAMIRPSSSMFSTKRGESIFLYYWTHVTKLEKGRIDDFTIWSNRIRNKLDSYPGLPHYFWVFPGLKSSEKFHANVAEGVKWVLSL